MQFFRGNRLSLLSLLVLLLGPLACGDDDIRDEYEAFLARTDRTNPNTIDPDAARGKGMVADITGEHLFNVDLRPIGAVKLRLRASFETFDLLEDGRAAVTGAFRLAEADPNVINPTSEPLALFESIIEEDGFMVIDLGRVYVPASLSPIPETAVDVVLKFKAVVLNGDEVCGFIDEPESMVLAPAPLDLVGTTFGSARWNRDGSQPASIPETCPFPLGIPDPGTTPPPETGDLVPPGIETPYGVVADLGGQFFMRAAVSGSSLVLDFIVKTTMETHESLPADCRRIRNGTDQYVRGELRTFTNDDRYGPDNPPVGSFCSQISPQGRFDAVVEGVIAPSSLGEVNADISLSAVIVSEDVFCATAGGTVTSPLSLNLIGSTAGFVRIPDDFWGLPESPLPGCPPVLAPSPSPVAGATGDAEAIDGRWFLFLDGDDDGPEGVLELTSIADLRTVVDEDDDLVVVDAVVRRYGNGARPTDPAIGFTSGAVLDENGQFVIRLNGVLDRLEGSTIVDGNVAIRAWAQDADTLCGIATGRIFRPFQAPFATFRVSARRLPSDVWGEVASRPTCP